MEFLPPARAPASVFRRRPFPLADDRQARAVDDELQAGAPGNGPQRKVEVLATTGERRVIRRPKVEPHQPEQRREEALGLTERQMKKETQRQSGFDREVRVLPLRAPVPVVEGVSVKLSGATDFAVSNNGRLVYRAGGGGRTSVWVDREGLETPVGVPPRRYGQPRISPDGTRLVFAASDPPNTDLWVHDVARGASTRLKFDTGLDDRPLWMPEGERVVFASTREGISNLFWRAVDGTGPVERLATSSGVQRPYAWTPDGQTLVYQDVPRH